MNALRKWFHNSRPEIWRKLSEELGARYTAGNWHTTDRIDVEHGPWTLTLDTFTVHAGHAHVPFTRLRAPFLSQEPLRMKLSHASIFSALGRFVGLQDIEVGDPDFDKAFVIKGSDEARVQRFLSGAALRAKLLADPKVQLSIEDDEGWFGAKFPEHVDELRLVVHGHLDKPERLRALLELFGEALDELMRAGLASDADPRLRL